jgi:hypothetical protein
MREEKREKMMLSDGGVWSWRRTTTVPGHPGVLFVLYEYSYIHTYSTRTIRVLYAARSLAAELPLHLLYHAEGGISILRPAYDQCRPYRHTFRRTDRSTRLRTAKRRAACGG